MQLGAWENAYFATRSKSRQKRVNCIILANFGIYDASYVLMG